MDTKQWLNRAYKIDMQITSKQEQIDMWHCLATKVTGSYIPRETSNVGNVSNKIENFCIKIACAETELEKEKAKLVDIKQEIKEAISKVGDVCHRVLLEQRYLMSKSWVEIAEFMGYCEEYIKKDMHRRALIAINDTITP